MFLDLTVKFLRRMAGEVLLEEYDARRAVFFQPVVIA
jgi:hypothetical protein